MSDIKKDTKDISVNSKNDSSFRSLFASFLRNEHHTFVVQKTEKLASALYVITGFIPNEDPLKTRLRTCAVDLVSTSADPSRAREVRYHEGFASRCLEIGSILSLAERAGFVSPMNARILCDEYAELAQFVKNHRDKVFGSEAAVGGAFLPANTASMPAAPVRPSASLVKDKDNTDHIKRINNYKRHLNRRDIILSLLDKKDKITVKDASDAIQGCSEKTIQRELIALVSEGVLLKEGERRWSTYRKISKLGT